MERPNFRKKLVGVEQEMLRLDNEDQYTSETNLIGKMHCHRIPVGNHPDSIGNYLQVYYRRFLPHG